MSQKKSTAAVTKGSAQIEFVMLKATVDDGNFAFIAQAITSALRQSDANGRLLVSTSTSKANGSDTNAVPADADAADHVTDHDDDGLNSETPAPPEARSTNGDRPRKKYVAKVKALADVDLDGGSVPFATFAEQKKPDNDAARCLVIATWFKQQRNLDAISANHVYTCYTRMSWGVLPDFAQVLRDLKKRGKGDYEKKFFTINHLGIGQVDRMK